MNDYARMWFDEHPGYFSARNRHLKHGDLTRAQWEMILSYFENRCAYCGSDGALQIEHILPVCRGGLHTAKNVVPACEPCNHRKYNHTPEEVAMAFVKPLPDWDMRFLADKQDCIATTRRWQEELK